MTKKSTVDQQSSYVQIVILFFVISLMNMYGQSKNDLYECNDVFLMKDVHMK